MRRRSAPMLLRGRTWLTAMAALMASNGFAVAEVSAETQYILNTLSFLFHGMLVLFMATGFSMLEAGLVRTKGVATILLKNFTLVSIAAVCFYLTGYRLMFDGVDGGFIGGIGIWTAGDAAALNGNFELGAASASIWMYQMLFAVTAASIISGALAERIKLWPFFIFIAVMAAVLYPIQGAWGWGGGWLSDLGFKDFAGGAHVHTAAGWAALTGAVVLGARRGRFAADGAPRSLPASSLPLATLGTMVLWLGWLGFNGGSQGSFSSASDAIAVANVYVNTIMASCGGVVTAVLLIQARTGKVDLTMVLNGALAGLVSITAGPDAPSIGEAILIGAVGSALMIATTLALLHFRVDDVIGAVPVHLSCGIWGTLAVPISNPDASLQTQAIGLAAVSGFMLISSAAIWLFLRATMRLRLSQGEEAIGIDKVETGALAYPEFATRRISGDI